MNNSDGFLKAIFVFLFITLLYFSFQQGASSVFALKMESKGYKLDLEPSNIRPIFEDSAGGLDLNKEETFAVEFSPQKESKLTLKEVLLTAISIISLLVLVILAPRIRFKIKKTS